MSTGPFLPAHSKTGYSSSPARAIAVGVVVLVLFFALWQYVDMNFPPEVQQWLVYAFLAAAFVWMLSRTIGFQSAQRDAKRLAVMLEPANAAFLSRRYADAAEQFQVLTTTFARSAVLRETLWTRVAIARLHEGDVDAALDTCRSVELDPATPASSDDRLTIARLLTLIHGLRGDLTTADIWLGAARQRAGLRQGAWRDGGVLHSLAEATLACRRGAFESGARRLDQATVLAPSDSSFTRAAELLRAFAADRAGDPPTAVEERLQRLLPVMPGEFTFLGAQWPAVEEFIERRCEPGKNIDTLTREP